MLGLAGAVILFGLRYLAARPQTSDAGKLMVTTSFYPVYYLAGEIGGNKIMAVNITPAGAEPHDYEPTPQDMIQIEKSRLLIINGGIEPWAGKIRKNLQGKQTQILEVNTGLVNQVSQDPHIWLDPVLAKQMADKIAQALVKLEPENATYFQTNVTILKVKLDQLDRAYREGLAKCRSNEIVTSHAAFSYLVDRYGLKQIAIAGLSPDAEPSLLDLARTADFVKMYQVKYIFFESLVSPKLARTLAAETGSRTLVLNPLEGLTQAEINSGQNYLSIMEDNLKNLRTALQCQ